VPELHIAVEPRTEFGKGAARRIRRADKVPAVVYGHGVDPHHIALPGHELMRALRTSNVLLEIDLDGRRELVLPKSVQRDPIRGNLEHVDLVIVKRGEKVTVDIGLSITGEVAPGGMLDQQMMTLSVIAEATSIPERLQISIEGFDVGRAVYAKDIELPAGAELAGTPDALVLHVVGAPSAEQLEAELAEAEAEAGIEHDVSDAEAAATAEAEAAGEVDRAGAAQG
jgi:large subunit ribosomal protein L25